METFSFADDSPRSDPGTEDDFGYAPFAKHLAEVLAHLSVPNGYVVGLHGQWGSGKTTALNFVRHYVEAENGEGTAAPLEIVPFQPWMFSGQQDLMSAFFRVLAARLKDSSDSILRAKKAARKAAKAAVDPLVKAAVTMAVAAHPPDTVAINAGGELAKRAMSQTIDAWLGEPTLQAAHDDLVVRLKKSGRRLLVIIDDIDRLEAGEIRSIMQMVKSVGRLPNTIYILAYDRRIVWRALAERKSQEDGEPTFTEKIVQHEIELPHASRAALLRKLDTETRFILHKVRGGARWFEIVQHGVQRWVRSPRDVLRFSNALRFTWPPLDGEVDPIDLVAMEGLRLFDVPAFDWIRANRDFLVDGHEYMPDEDKAAHAAKFRDSLDPNRRDDVVEVVSAVFPSKAKLLRGNDRFGYGELWAETINRRGVGSPRGFEAYFALFPSAHGISKSVVDSAAEATDDRTAQDRALKTAMETVDLAGTSLVGEYLDELQYRMIGRHKMKPGRAMVLALLGQAPFIQRQDRSGMSLFPPHIQLQFLVREILATWEIATASAVLTDFIDECESASVAASLYVWRAREAGLLPAEGSEVGAVISDEALARIGEKTLALIQAEAADGRLIEAPYYFDIMVAWAQLDPQAPARDWLMVAVQTDPHALAKASKGFLASTTAEDRTTVYFFRGFSTERPFYEAPQLLAASEAFADHPDLDDDERARIVAVRDGLRILVAKEGAVTDIPEASLGPASGEAEEGG